ncbi:MAG: DivIVA domain-containing protein [Clostridia bacterium]|nr:DivIVA domain-containing protein [Clostridia bacterium]
MQTEETEKLKEQLNDLNSKRSEEEIHISKLGSVAEAAVQISGVMTAAQNTADMYLNIAKKRADSIIEDAHKKADEIIRTATKKAARSTDLK